MVPGLSAALSKCEVRHRDQLWTCACRFQRYIPRTVRKQQAEDDLPLFQSTMVQMGNLVGPHKAVYGFELQAITDMRLAANGLTWELQYLGNRFRFEVICLAVLLLEHVQAC